MPESLFSFANFLFSKIFRRRINSTLSRLHFWQTLPYYSLGWRANSSGPYMVAPEWVLVGQVGSRVQCRIRLRSVGNHTSLSSSISSPSNRSFTLAIIYASRAFSFSWTKPGPISVMDGSLGVSPSPRTIACVPLFLSFWSVSFTFDRSISFRSRYAKTKSPAGTFTSAGESPFKLQGAFTPTGYLPF